MRTRTLAIAFICTASALTLLALPLWAQPVPVPPVAPVTAAAPVAAVAPAAAVAPVAIPAIIGQTPPPPAPPAPAQVPKVQAPTAPAPPGAPPVPTDSPAANMNVRVEVTISDQTGSGAPTKKTVSLTVSDNGRGSVRSGVTVPIPSTTYAPAVSKEGADTKPIMSYTYKDMGLSLDVMDTRIRGNYVRLRLAVEYNPVDEKMAATEGSGVSWLAQGPASFARFSQTLDLALENGKPLVVASSSDPVPSRNRTASLEVKATILK